MDKKIRALVIPRIYFKQSYIHVGRMYEERMVRTIRHEPFEGRSIYGVYDDDGDHICSLEDCGVIVYYFKGDIKHEN